MRKLELLGIINDSIHVIASTNEKMPVGHQYFCQSWHFLNHCQSGKIPVHDMYFNNTVGKSPLPDKWLMANCPTEWYEFTFGKMIHTRIEYPFPTPFWFPIMTGRLFPQRYSPYRQEDICFQSKTRPWMPMPG